MSEWTGERIPGQSFKEYSKEYDEHMGFTPNCGSCGCGLVEYPIRVCWEVIEVCKLCVPKHEALKP